MIKRGGTSRVSLQKTKLPGNFSIRLFTVPYFSVGFPRLVQFIGTCHIVCVGWPGACKHVTAGRAVILNACRVGAIPTLLGSRFHVPMVHRR